MGEITDLLPKPRCLDTSIAFTAVYTNLLTAARRNIFAGISFSLFYTIVSSAWARKSDHQYSQNKAGFQHEHCHIISKLEDCSRRYTNGWIMLWR